MADQLRLSWDEAAGIQARAVARGLQRRELAPARHPGIDETAFQRRHEYVTVVTDLDRARVLYVADTRRRESLDAFWAARGRRPRGTRSRRWRWICGSPTERIFETRPDYVLVLPWNLKAEIMKQMAAIRDWGGQFGIPIPEVKIEP